MKYLAKILLTIFLVQGIGAEREHRFRTMMELENALEIITTGVQDVTDEVMDKNNALMDKANGVLERLTKEDKAGDLGPIEKRILTIGNNIKLMLQDINAMFKEGLGRITSTNGSVSIQDISECAKEIFDTMLFLYDKAVTQIDSIQLTAEQFIANITLCLDDSAPGKDCVKEAKNEMPQIDEAEICADNLRDTIDNFNINDFVNTTCLNN